jgi:hypothetical protein
MVVRVKIKMKKHWIKNIIRISPNDIDRSKFLRLDKNERVINFEKKFCEIKKGYTFTMFKGLGF